MPTVRETLAASNLRELFYLLNMCGWILTQLSSDHDKELGMERESWHEVSELVRSTFWEKELRTRGKEQWISSEDAPLGLISIFDQFQEQILYEIPDIV